MIYSAHKTCGGKIVESNCGGKVPEFSAESL